MEATAGSYDRIGLVLLPQFNAMATLAFVDPFRAANYLNAKLLYSWSFLSLDGEPVDASNGAKLGPTTAVDEAGSAFDFVLISASWTPEAYQDKRLFRWLRTCARAGAALGGIDTGAFVLAFAGLLDQHRATVHYEHIDAFNELFPEIDTQDDLFVFDHNRLTCCGGAASVDMALEVIRRQHGVDQANAAARYIFHDRLRPASEPQNPSLHEPVGYAVPPVLREAIILMERNLEDPIPVPEIARLADLSQRQMERLFRRHTGVAPVRYYLDIRLDRARGLVTQTEMSIFSIAVACGFSSSEQFARAYKRRFELNPSDDRVQGRVPYQFRAFPSFATGFGDGKDQ